MTVQPLWSPLDPANISNPYPMYQRLRNESPIHKSQTGEFIITRYDDVKSILKNKEYRTGNKLDWISRGVQYFKNQDEDLGNIYNAINTFVLFLNAADHVSVRTMVMKTWNNHEVHQMIEDTADKLLKDLSGTFDVVERYAKHLPAIVICKIMGIPMDDYQHLSTLGVNMIRSLDPYHSWKDLVELNATSGEFVRYFTDLLEHKRKHPDEGIVSRLLVANDREKVLRDEQLISVLIFLFIAGEESTASSIGTGLRNIIENKRVYGTVNETVIDELFRFDPPVQLLGRITKSESVIGGMSIPPDSTLTLILGSANRDETQFHNASTIDINRSPNPHLSFGYGTHFCLGEWLGKLQTHIALKRFTAKFTSAEIVEQNIQWNKNLAVRGMKSMIINATE